MGDVSASDCSWKKMVIAKADDTSTWMSTIKNEQQAEDRKSCTNSSARAMVNSKTDSDTNTWVSNIKNEQYILSDTEQGAAHFMDPDSQYGTGKNDLYYTAGCSEDYRTQSNPYLEMSQGTCLLQEIAHPPRRRRSKGSGPKPETPEERAIRLAKMSAYVSQRLAKETPEQRSTRLKRMSEYAARRLARETQEQRAMRLKRMSEYAARRIARESPEQRRARLARMSAYAAKRRNSKPPQDDSVIVNEEDPLAD